MIAAARGILWAALILSALVLAARAIFGPFHLGVPITSPMNAEGIFALSGIGLLACPARKARQSALTSRTFPITLVAVTLTIAAALAYARTLNFPFLADDYDHIPHAIHATPTYLAALFTQPATDRFFRPMGFIAYAAEARIAGFSRAGWHTLSILLHVAVSLLVFAFARRRNFSPPIALADALLFLLHGSRPEAVTWISAQFDLWAAFFFLIALLTYESPWSLVALLAALLSKESAYVYPLILLLLLCIDRVPRKQWPRLALPPFLLTAAVFLYRWRLVGGIGGYRNIGSNQPYIFTFDFFRTTKSLTARLAAALDFPINWSHPLEWWLIAMLLAAMAAGAVLAATTVDRRKLAFAVGFLLLAALPVHEFLGIGPDLEKSRVLYLPSVGFALIFAASLEAVRPRIAIGAACAILTFQLAALEHNLKIWDGVAHLAERTCQDLARTSPAVLPDVPNSVDGVYFLHTGLRSCVELAARR